MEKYSTLFISIFVLLIIAVLFASRRQRRSTKLWLRDYVSRVGGKLEIGYDAEGEILNFSANRGGIFQTRPGTGSTRFPTKGAQDGFRIKDFPISKGAELFNRQTIYSMQFSQQFATSNSDRWSKIVAKVPRVRPGNFQAYIMSFIIDMPPVPEVKSYKGAYATDEDIFKKLDMAVNFNQLCSKFNAETTGWGQPFPDIIIGQDSVEVQINQNTIYMKDYREKAIQLLFETALLVRDELEQIDK
ncbi:MAG: hypothetical protein NT155_00130 [Candidatus Staskawiczbacteria bacterium]|nr:hypothetical protein [Candidatus Staskawiczbacteria bacterium]